MAITAATPMRIPRMDRALRNLLAAIALSAEAAYSLTWDRLKSLGRKGPGCDERFSGDAPAVAGTAGAGDLSVKMGPPLIQNPRLRRGRSSAPLVNNVTVMPAYLRRV